MARVMAQCGPVAVAFEGSLYGPTERTIEFVAPVRLGEVDLVAALWRCTPEGLSADELANPQVVRELVVDTIVNAGLDEVDEARAQVADVVPGTGEHAWLQQLQAAVRRAFAPVLSAPAGRALVGVA
jgi:hypothetical protein